MSPAFLDLFPKSTNILVAGAGGFIGGALTGWLVTNGYKHVRAVDIKPRDRWYQWHNDACNWSGEDLSELGNAQDALAGREVAIQLAADMGGIGYIEGSRADCAFSVQINTNILRSARGALPLKRLFYSSSACVYAAGKQRDPNVTALKESDAFPAEAEVGYGEEKLFSERLYQLAREDWNVPSRVARFHNIYGPYGTYRGGREKAPAAVCRKVAEAVLSGKHEIEIWGDGEQSRSFCYIDDCVRGILDITAGEFTGPVNLGSSELVTINQMVSIVEEIAGVKLQRSYKLDAPQGVRGRNSDNTLFKSVYGWEPSISLRAGLEKTYAWIYDQLKSRA